MDFNKLNDANTNKISKKTFNPTRGISRTLDSRPRIEAKLYKLEEQFYKSRRAELLSEVNIDIEKIYNDHKESIKDLVKQKFEYQRRFENTDKALRTMRFPTDYHDVYRELQLEKLKHMGDKKRLIRKFKEQQIYRMNRKLYKI